MLPIEKLHHIDALHAAAKRGSAADIHTIIAATNDPDWTIVQASLLAAQLNPRAEYASAIFAVLDRQDALPIYSQKESDDPLTFPKPTQEIWKNRYRVKQIACLALGAIAASKGSAALPAKAIERLAAYASNPAGEEYPVRAASAHALGQIRGPIADAALAITAKDPEFCTATEARKALGLAPVH